MKKTVLILIVFTMQLLYAGTDAKTILFLGDSLTEGLGVSKKQAYPHQVQIMFQNKSDTKIDVINGGVSGSTTGDGLARLQWYLKKKPDVIFIALGANDGLRGLDLDQSQKNLERIIKQALDSGAKVLLAGQRIPPNYGPKYTQKFKQMYQKVQKGYDIGYMPFLLKGVAGKQAFNQADGIHPNAKGHKQIAQEVFEFLQKEL